jgi:hypothetical protein
MARIQIERLTSPEVPDEPLTLEDILRPPRATSLAGPMADSYRVSR